MDQLGHALSKQRLSRRCAQIAETRLGILRTGSGRAFIPFWGRSEVFLINQGTPGDARKAD